MSIRRSVVEPADHVQQSAGRHDRLHIILVVVDGVPVVVPARARHRLGLHGLARIDQFEALILASNMHVRLPGGDLRRGVQTGVAVAAHDRVSGNVDVWSGLLPELFRPLNVLGHVALGVKHDPKLDLRLNLFADGMEVIADPRVLPGLQQHAGVGRGECRILARRVLHEELSTAASSVVAHVAVVTRFNRVRKGVVNHLSGVSVNHPALDGLDIAIFFRTERGGQGAVQIRAGRRHLERGVFHDQIRRAYPPGRHVVESWHGGHVGGVPLDGAAVDPFDDRRDLVITQRRIVLVLLDADRLVEEPGRHLALADALLDRLRPGPRVVVREQRHRRDLAGTMTPDARPVQNRRDVLRERCPSFGRPALLRADHRGRCDADGDRPQGQRSRLEKRVAADNSPHPEPPRLRESR